jgi:hypothetical protein
LPHNSSYFRSGEMSVRQQSKHELAEELHRQYLRAKRAEKGRLLDQFVGVTGYHRKYAVGLLRQGPPARVTGRGGGHPIVYGPEVLVALEVAAEAAGWICGKRLAPFLGELVPVLEQEGALTLGHGVRIALLRMSAATLDRRLRAARLRERPRGFSTTKPGSLLRRQVPIRTYTPWDEEKAGFLEIDTVAHCGTSTAGSYLCTLNTVDIATQWTECEAVSGKTQGAVFGAIERVRSRLPFPLLGIDFDNGSEFLNDHLIRYCQQERISYTRARAYHKNDQAHVEQKNWTVVRQFVGYDRFESPAALVQLRSVYELLRVYVNFFQPVMKLIGKERAGAKVRKKYDGAQTPYRRALAAGVVPEEQQAALEALMPTRGPLALRRWLDAELERLWRLSVGARPEVQTG